MEIQTARDLRRRRPTNRSRQSTILRRLFLLAILVLSAPAIYLTLQNGGRPRTAGSARFAASQTAPSRKPPELGTPDWPAFATSGDITLYLPFPRSKLTALAFHQATNPNALGMSPRSVEAGAKKAADANVLVHHRLWRPGRSGMPNRAVDIGAKAGAVVRSPVDGTVLKVKYYRLYGKYPDFEIWIRPRSTDRRKVVIIHVDAVRLERGQMVEAGVTYIGRVRNLAQYFPTQLRHFSKDAGNHIHLQVNRG